MIKYKLIIAEVAVFQLADACLFYQSREINLGKDLEQEVTDLLKIIEANPFLFSVKFGTMREAVVKRFPFVIVYEIIDRSILIVSVFHTKQNPKKKTRK
jgi:hypothetical protein